MNIYTLLMIIPVVLAVALIIMIIRRNITENPGRSIDIAPAIPAVVVLMIAILVIAPMAESTQDYLFDDKTGELTIQKNITQASVQPWDEYADEVTSLVIKDGLSIGSGAFDSLTSLEYLKIGDDVSLGSSVFGVTLANALGNSVLPATGEYMGPGDGTLYVADGSIFTYSGAIITGLATAYSGAVAIVIPAEHSGVEIERINGSAFASDTDLAYVAAVPDCKMNTIASNVFEGCTALEKVVLPASLTALGNEVFKGCAALEDVEMPDTVTSAGFGAFLNCTSLKSVGISDGLTEIRYSFMQGCSSLESVVIPDGVATIGSGAFTGCTGIQMVSFGTGLTTVNSAFPAWTFYASDGVTQLDKTVASDLAGKTFMGTASALVEVSAGTLSLTPQQLQQVQLHTQELQQQELDIQPLPFQPAVQTQDQEQETA